MPSWTMASIRAWPNAPRDCLLASTSRKRGDLRGQIGEILVRVVDDAEPLMQHAQAVHGVAGGGFHRLADPVRHRIQPLVDRARHLGLAADQRLRHRVDPAGGLALRPQHLAEALLQLVGADGLRHRHFRPAAAGAGDDDGDGQQQHQRQRAEADQRLAGVDRRSPTMKRISFMPLL